MSKHDSDTLYALGAAYDDVDAAVADYEAVKELYRAIRSSDEFDAAVIAKDEKGKVHIVKKHEQPTRHGAAVGLGWGLAVGVAAALFPPLGIGIATAGGAGAAIGSVAGHAAGGISRGDLKDLGETLDAGQAGLVVVYAFNLADQVAATVKAANRVVSRATDMAADQLAEELRSAEKERPVPPPRGSEEAASTTPSAETSTSAAGTSPAG
ncbi:MAG: DUF1269 domain-containing protein [Catenulispora sp.]